jgi:hypothetical protein
MAVTGKPGCCTDALRRSHRQARDRLTTLAEDLLAELPSGHGAARARTALVDFVRGEIIPRAAAEESVARTADSALQPLVRALPGHHRMLEVLVDEIDSGSGDITTAAAVGALVLLCDARWDGEDHELMPALAAAGVDLQELAGRGPAAATVGQQ